jgi:hypothetical protein
MARGPFHALGMAIRGQHLTSTRLPKLGWLFAYLISNNLTGVIFGKVTGAFKPLPAVGTIIQAKLHRSLKGFPIPR